MSVPSSWAIRNEKLGVRRVDKYGKGQYFKVFRNFFPALKIV